MALELTVEQILELEPEELLKVRLAQIPPQDALIFSLGAILGYKGYTPITALLNLAKGAGDRAGVRVSDILTSLIFPYPTAVNIVIGFLLGQGTPTTADQSRRAEAEAAMLNAMLGAIEAYAITRPGAIGGILQGIGEIVPL